jgi:hypothetical protein
MTEDTDGEAGAALRGPASSDTAEDGAAGASADSQHPRHRRPRKMLPPPSQDSPEAGGQQDAAGAEGEEPRFDR